MPLSIKRRVTLDLSRTGYQVTIPFMKSDRVAHEIYITVKDGTEPVILPPGTMAAITVFNGVEGGVVDNLVVDHANNVLMYVPSPNALAVAGNVKCTLTLFDELGAVIGAPSMIFGVMNSDTEATEVEIQAALEANPSWGLIVTAAQSAESAKASSNEASQAAVEAYASELHAKFYSEAAQDSEAIVNLYKTDALTYRNVAELKATEAANSAAAAKTSEESARADAESVVGSRAEIDAEISDVSQIAYSALGLATGATRGYVVSNYAKLVEMLNNMDKDHLNVGQNIYVETLDVPDVWVKGYANDPIEYTYTTDANLERELLGGYLQIGYTLLSPLEGAKVDLTDYAKKTYVNSEIGKSEDRSSTKIREANKRIDANEAAINSANEQIDSANRSIGANAANITALEQSTAEQISTVAKHTAAVESMASRNSKRLDNIEAGIPDDDFITDNSVAYVRDVPANVLPFALIEEIGGVTRKCAQLFDVAKAQIGYRCNTDGSLVKNSSYATSDYIEVKSGTSYYLTNVCGNNYCSAVLFDANKACVNSTLLGTGGKVSGVLNLDSNIKYIRINIFTDVVDINTVMVNEGTTALPYEPFFEGLRSAPVYEVLSEGANLTTAQAVYKGAQRYEELVADGRNCIRFTSGATYETTPITFAPNTQYTVSFYAKGENFNGATVSNTAFTFYYDDDTSSRVQVGQDSLWSFVSLTSTNGKTVRAIGVTSNEYRAYVYIDTDTFMLNKGTTALRYRPYIKRTLAIPEVVRPAHGIPNTDCYDRIRWRYDEATDKWVRESEKQIEKFVLDGSSDEKWYLFRENQYGAFVYQTSLKSKLLAISDKFTFAYGAWGNKGVGYFSPNGNDVFFNTDKATVDEWKKHIAKNPITVFYTLLNPEITDISDILPEDNLIGVEGGGTITMANEYGYDVPATVIYQIDKEDTI